MSPVFANAQLVSSKIPTMLFCHGFMLDTCAINRIHDQEVSADEWTLRGRIYVTDIQMQEVAQTPEPGRRDSLLTALFSLRPSVIRPGLSLTCADAWHADYGHGYDNDDHLNSYELSYGRLVPSMAATLGGKPGKLQNRLRDALIAESARANCLTLVTSDKKLVKMALSLGIPVETIQ
jgi:predicted nucleic acid-binding protein